MSLHYHLMGESRRQKDDIQFALPARFPLLSSQSIKSIPPRVLKGCKRGREDTSDPFSPSHNGERKEGMTSHPLPTMHPLFPLPLSLLSTSRGLFFPPFSCAGIAMMHTSTFPFAPAIHTFHSCANADELYMYVYIRHFIPPHTQLTGMACVLI